MSHQLNGQTIKLQKNSSLASSWTSHTYVWVFGCLAWVHILKKRRHKLEPKSQAIIFVRYEDGSKGYIFWDAAHQHLKISHDVKFKETCFPAKETILAQPDMASQNDHQFLESDNKSDSSGLDLVKLIQPSTRPPSPSWSAPTEVITLRGPVMSPQSAPPVALPLVPWGTSALPDVEAVPLQPPHHNTLFIQQNRDWTDEHKPDHLQTVSTMFWYTCSKRPQIPTRKLWIHWKRTNG